MSHLRVLQSGVSGAGSGHVLNMHKKNDCQRQSFFLCI